jgi:hypothetical protein
MTIDQGIILPFTSMQNVVMDLLQLFVNYGSASYLK